MSDFEAELDLLLKNVGDAQHVVPDDFDSRLSTTSFSSVSWSLAASPNFDSNNATGEAQLDSSQSSLAQELAPSACAEHEFTLGSPSNMSDSRDLFDTAPVALKVTQSLPSRDFLEPSTWDAVTAPARKVVITVSADMKSIDAARAELGVLPCTCKKSRCRKKYCECFAAGIACGSMCQCIGCCNNDPSCLGKSAKERKKTCSCRNSKCLKKYCVCYAAGRSCSSNCVCVNCKNSGDTELSASSAELPGPPLKRRRVAHL